MSVLAAIAVLAVLIVVHELGHFTAARVQGIRVNRFSVGFGPVLWKYQGAETEYAVRALPLGGFVGFPDDDPDSKVQPDDPNLMRNRPLLDRAIVISAGVIANFIFAYFLLVAQSGTIGIPESNFQPGVAVPEVVSEETSPAAEAGMQAGDVIVAVDSQKLGESREAINSLQQEIQSSVKEPLALTIKRDEKTISVTVTPKADEAGEGKIGVMLAPNGEITRRQPDNILEAFPAGAQEYQRIFNLTFEGFGRLIGNFQESAGQVAGPVKIVEVGANIASSNAASLLQFGALISINLGIINILPLPVLDGGQLAFLALEGVRGEPLPSKIQNGITQTGVVLLLGLAVFLIIRDTANLAVVQELFQ
ncbi:MAG: RIP metalloprotease RseP [Cyanobacteria bacterium SW_7_48_12]|jgi:membrane-associated protease RseP (regulator of RpoE activity)|nr:MAG: RIP metalloprotease RseP [Cyanobacteria bacterium SW_7_48_12]